MSRWLGAICIALAAGLVFTAADAQEAKKVDVTAIFKKLDTNNDGKLSKDEFLKLADRYKNKEKAREKLTMTFDKLDPQNIGLSIEQFRKYLESLDNLKKKTP